MPVFCCANLSVTADVPMCAGGDDLVCDKWPKFLSSLQAQLVKYKRDTFPGLSSLKLLVTNLMDFPRVMDV